MRAAVERNVNPQLGSGIKDFLFPGIFANCVDKSAVWNSVHDRGPGFAEIRRFENVRLEIVEFVSVHRGVSGLAIAR